MIQKDTKRLRSVDRTQTHKYNKTQKKKKVWRNKGEQEGGRMVQKKIEKTKHKHKNDEDRTRTTKEEETHHTPYNRNTRDTKTINNNRKETKRTQ